MIDIIDWNDLEKSEYNEFQNSVIKFHILYTQITLYTLILNLIQKFLTVYYFN